MSEYIYDVKSWSPKNRGDVTNVALMRRYRDEHGWYTWEVAEVYRDRLFWRPAGSLVEDIPPTFELLPAEADGLLRQMRQPSTSHSFAQDFIDGLDMIEEMEQAMQDSLPPS